MKASKWAGGFNNGMQKINSTKRETERNLKKASAAPTREREEHEKEAEELLKA